MDFQYNANSAAVKTARQPINMGKSFSVDEVDLYPMERMWDGDRRLPAFGYTIETVQMLMIPMVKTRYSQPQMFSVLVGID